MKPDPENRWRTGDLVRYVTDMAKWQPGTDIRKIRKSWGTYVVVCERDEDEYAEKCSRDHASSACSLFRPVSPLELLAGCAE